MSKQILNTKKIKDEDGNIKKTINTVEVLECTGQYDKIEPNKVPSRCMHIKKRAAPLLKTKKIVSVEY